MKILGSYILKLPGEGWNTSTDRYCTKFGIYYNMRTGIIDVIKTEQDNKFGHTIRHRLIYESPDRFVYDFCKRYGKDIRDYTDITELEPGVECLLCCYLFILYERMIDQTIDNMDNDDGGDV